MVKKTETKSAATKKAVTKKVIKSDESKSSTPLQWNVFNMAGKEVGTVELHPEVFGIEPNQDLVHDTVRWQLAKRRSGTHQALTRTMMRASNKKPFKQKHTGRARAGSTISPLWVGGASIHGPLPRSYDYGLPKRTRRQALASVLSDKVLGKSLIIIDALKIKDKKTKSMVEVLKAVGVNNESAIIVTPTKEDSVWFSSRNIKNVMPMDAGSINVYDLLKHKFLVCTKETIKNFETRVLKD